MSPKKGIGGRLLAGAACALLLAGCGSDPAPSGAGATTDDNPPSLRTTGSGPDPTQAKARLLFNANMAVPDAARIVSYREIGVRYEGPSQMQSAIVDYEAELEFTADTYFHADHKAGDRTQVYGEIEYLNEGGNWRLMTMGIYPK